MSETQKVSDQANKTAPNNNKKENNTKARPKKTPKVRKFHLLLSILFFIYEISNIALFIIFKQKEPKQNIQGIPINEFNEPNSFYKIVHWIFHSILLIFIVFLGFYSFIEYLDNYNTLISLGTAFSTLLAFIFWVSYFGIIVVDTPDVKNLIEINDLKQLLEGPPTKLAFFYSKDKVKTHNLTRNPANGQMVDSNSIVKCYSNRGISLPLTSELINERYDFLNAPEFFYFKIDQHIESTNDFQLEYNKTIQKIKSCTKTNTRVKFFPYLNKTFAVGNPKYPKYLTHQVRMLSAALGFGFYYNSYSISFPFIVYEQKIKVDIDHGFNYSNLWAPKWCKSFGKCDPMNMKPLPNDDEL